MNRAIVGAAVVVVALGVGCGDRTTNTSSPGATELSPTSLATTSVVESSSTAVDTSLLPATTVTEPSIAVWEDPTPLLGMEFVTGTNEELLRSLTIAPDGALCCSGRGFFDDKGVYGVWQRIQHPSRDSRALLLFTRPVDGTSEATPGEQFFVADLLMLSLEPGQVYSWTEEVCRTGGGRSDDALFGIIEEKEREDGYHQAVRAWRFLRDEGLVEVDPTDVTCLGMG
jgi:hypothetical protein